MKWPWTRSADEVARQLDELRLAIGRLESRRARSRECTGLRDAEFKVFSQFGEDGIIQYLLARVPIANPTFVEFGVQDYSESNTRFLLGNDGWRGLIIDAGSAHRRFIAERELDWRHDLTAISAFITRENIDGLLRAAGFAGDIGLLSVDIDGNDYWVLEAIEAVSPRILVVEYNALFGPELAVTIPYAPGFERHRAHWSGAYYGASLAGLAELGARKGYGLVGCNSAGNNAFFVRRDVLGDLPALAPRDAWVMSRFRDSRDERGQLTFESDRGARLGRLAGLDLVCVPEGRVATIGSLFGTGPAVSGS